MSIGSRVYGRLFKTAAIALMKENSYVLSWMLVILKCLRSTLFSRPFFLSYQLSLTYGSILRIAVVLQLKIPEYKAQN